MTSTRTTRKRASDERKSPFLRLKEWQSRKTERTKQILLLVGVVGGMLVIVFALAGLAHIVESFVRVFGLLSAYLVKVGLFMLLPTICAVWFFGISFHVYRPHGLAIAGFLTASLTMLTGAVSGIKALERLDEASARLESMSRSCLGERNGVVIRAYDSGILLLAHSGRLMWVPKGEKELCWAMPLSPVRVTTIRVTPTFLCKPVPWLSYSFRAVSRRDKPYQPDSYEPTRCKSAKAPD